MFGCVDLALRKKLDPAVVEVFVEYVHCQLLDRVYVLHHNQKTN